MINYSGVRTVVKYDWLFMICKSLTPLVKGLTRVEIHEDVDCEKASALLLNFKEGRKSLKIAKSQGTSLIWEPDNKLTVGCLIILQHAECERQVFPSVVRKYFLTRYGIESDIPHSSEKKKMREFQKWKTLKEDWEKFSNVKDLAKYYGKPYATVRAALVRHGILKKGQGKRKRG